MIDETTSLTLNLAFKNPGTNAHTAPASNPDKIRTTKSTGLGILLP